jgi:lauroyl/myristoyl acyltransferase
MPSSKGTAAKRPLLASRDIGDTPWLVRRDLYLFLYIPAIAIFSWLLPDRWWWSFACALARLSLFVKRNRAAYRARFAKVLAGHRVEVDLDEVICAHLANNHFRYLQGMRCYAPYGWHPRIRLVGREHIERALAAGKGAILWVAPMASRDLVPKMALYQAGFRVSHLSRYSHGFSRSLLGARLFNPIWTRIENRYLAERLVLSHVNYTAPLRVLVRRLQENRLVSVTAVDAGLRTPELPFLNGTIKISEGAPALTLKTGAALLPVFVVRQVDGSYVVNVDSPLQPPTGVTGDDAIRALFLSFVRIHESYALRYPTQNLVWSV